MIFKTSGTSGVVKTFDLTDDQMQVRIDRLLEVTPGLEYVTKLYLGNNPESSSAERYLTYMVLNKGKAYLRRSWRDVTGASLITEGFNGIVAPPLEMFRLASTRMDGVIVRFAAVTGAVCQHKYKETILKLCPNAIMTYGTSETGRIAVGEVDSVLKICDDVDWDIRDGILWVKVPGMCTGYTNANGKENLFKEGWFCTGDPVRVYPDRRLIVLPRPATTKVQ